MTSVIDTLPFVIKMSPDERQTRITVDLKELYDPVKKLADGAGVAMSELIRRLVEVAMKQYGRRVLIEAVMSAGTPACPECGGSSGAPVVFQVRFSDTQQSQAICTECYNSRIKSGVWLSASEGRHP